MAIIVIEDGTEISGANSYVTEAELTTYATDRGVTLTVSADVLIVQAMDYIESLSYIGEKKTQNQALQWPRNQVYIDGYLLDNSTIPGELKNGQLAVALAIDAGNNPLGTIDREVKREKVDVIEVEYSDNAASVAINRTINAALKKLIRNGGGLQVTRA